MSLGWPMGTARDEAVVDTEVRWARRNERVRALLLKGSWGRGEADEFSAVDLGTAGPASQTSGNSGLGPRLVRKGLVW